MAKKLKRLGRRVAIVAGLRTPFCKAGTDLSKLTSIDLGKAVVWELLQRTEIDPLEIDAMVYGNVVPFPIAPNIAREILLGLDLPGHIQATTVMRACASGTESTAQAANSIALGYTDCAIVGGVDSLSDVPILLGKKLTDTLVKASRAKGMKAQLKLFSQIRPADLAPRPPAIAERSTGKSMGWHAEAMAKLNEISREAQDELAYQSHAKAHAATEDGRLPAEIAPVYIPATGKAVVADNHIRGDSTVEALAKLRPVYDKKYGSVTAGNACPITDGASALLIMAEEKAKALGYSPMGYVTTHAFAAVDPHWQLLIGPAFAVSRALSQAGLKLSDIDLFDIHEAFAAQVLSNMKALASRSFAQQHLGRGQAVGEVDPERFNVCGGSIAMGHPFAATSGRQIVTVLNELKRRGGQYGLVTQCAAGAMGGAMILERE